MTRLESACAVSLLALVGACTEGSGSVRIELTDAPPEDLRAAVVTIEEVYLTGANDTGRVVLRDTPMVVSLLTLSNDIATLVEDHPVPNGTYTQLRFVISGAYIEVANPDGTTTFFATRDYAEAPRIDAELKTPSWSSSGLKVKLPDDRLVVEGDQRVLLVEFDVAASFTHMTGSGDWVASPVIRATDLALSSTLHIDVSAPPGGDVRALGPLSVELQDALGLHEGSLALTDEDEDGVFSAEFLFLDPREGPFVLTVESPVTGVIDTDPPTPMTLTTESGGVTSVSFTALDAGP